MTTWISKAILACAAALTLKGCGEISAPRQMTEVSLAGGAVRVATPPGYCIDGGSIRQSPRAGFAMIARCDALDRRGFAAGQELALITVTTGRHTDGTPAPGLDEMARAAAPARILSRRMLGDLPMLRLDTGAGPVAEVSPQHWRTAFVANGYLVALALYAPDGSKALEAGGMRVLQDLANRTRRASARPLLADDKPAKAQTPRTPRNASPLAALAGLFE